MSKAAVKPSLRILEACCTIDYLRRGRVIQYDKSLLPEEEKEELRLSKGALKFTSEEIEDFDVDGLRFALTRISTLPASEAVKTAATLWQLLLVLLC